MRRPSRWSGSSAVHRGLEELESLVKKKGGLPLCRLLSPVLARRSPEDMADKKSAAARKKDLPQKSEVRKTAAPAPKKAGKAAAAPPKPVRAKAKILEATEAPSAKV